MHEKRGIENQPVDNVEWIDRESLQANDYNPNVVAPPELKLLKVSIMEDGWTQPIVTLPGGTIVDGYHRWRVSGDPEVNAMTSGRVPIVRLEADAVHRKMSTIRHNRARGQHAVLRMAEIIQSMIEEGVPLEKMMALLQMEDEEVLRLAQRMGIPERMITREFGKSWVPKLDT